MSFMFIILLLFVMPGCFSVKTTKEFNNLQKKVKKVTWSPIEYLATSCCQPQPPLPEGLSRNQAIGIALKYNPDLQADFENIGIAKADLEQAGLYTNPNINSVFRLPTKTKGPGTGQTNIESTASFRLADLWQVPLTKRVSEDLLEIITLRILTTILDIIERTTFAYDGVVAAKANLQNVLDTLQEVKEFKDEVYYRQGYGYSSDLDKYNADIMIEYLELERIAHQALLHTAFIHLRSMMGLEPSSTPLMATDGLCRIIPLSSQAELELFALSERPEIQIAQMKIKQYNDTISLEKSKTWTDVDIGVSYKQDFDKPFRGWGPYVSFAIPIFDSNYAQIARARFLLKQAEKELCAAILHVKEEIRTAFENLNAAEQEVVRYKDHILPTHHKAIDWAFTYAHTMQVNMLVAIQTRINLYEDTKKYIDNQQKLAHTFAELERAVGKQLTLSFNSESGNSICTEIIMDCAR